MALITYRSHFDALVGFVGNPFSSCSFVSCAAVRYLGLSSMPSCPLRECSCRD